jgi:hypothetical protein
MEVARQNIGPKKVPKTPKPPKPPFNIKVFLPKAKGGKTIAEYRLNDHIFPFDVSHSQTSVPSRSMARTL